MLLGDIQIWDKRRKCILMSEGVRREWVQAGAQEWESSGQGCRAGEGG